MGSRPENEQLTAGESKAPARGNTPIREKRLTKGRAGGIMEKKDSALPRPGRLLPSFPGA